MTKPTVVIHIVCCNDIPQEAYCDKFKALEITDKYNRESNKSKDTSNVSMFKYYNMKTIVIKDR